MCDALLFSQQSYVQWLYSALGFRYSFLLPVAAGLAFFLTLAVVLWGNRRNSAAALCFVVPLPLLIGLFAMLDGLAASFSVMAASSSQPKPSEIATGLSLAIVAPMVGMLLMAPSFLVALCGLTARAFTADGVSVTN